MRRGLLAALLVAAAALSFVLTLGALSAAVLVYPAGEMTLPVRLASLLHFGEDAIVAALCLMVSCFVIGLLLLCQLLVRRPLIPTSGNTVTRRATSQASPAGCYGELGRPCSP